MKKPRFFKNQHRFRAWLEKNHDNEDEIVVGYHKVKTGKPSMTWPESVDQALCFGWIDGIRRSIDDESYSVRFTPRRAGSTWSAVNIAKVEKLKQAGLMTPAGLKPFEERGADNEKGYTSSIAGRESLDRTLRAEFRKHKKAWAFFSKQPPGYRSQAEHWIMSAKRDETRKRRLARVIAANEKGERNI